MSIEDWKDVYGKLREMDYRIYLFTFKYLCDWHLIKGDPWLTRLTLIHNKIIIIAWYDTILTA